jgi:hypothetical protein
MSVRPSSSEKSIKPVDGQVEDDDDDDDDYDYSGDDSDQLEVPDEVINQDQPNPLDMDDDEVQAYLWFLLFTRDVHCII